MFYNIRMIILYLANKDFFKKKDLLVQNIKTIILEFIYIDTLGKI